MRSLSVLSFAFAVLIVASGCQRDAMAPVKGRVTCNGQPVKDVTITFSPVPESEKDKEPGKPGTGHTDAEGNFVLSTFKEYDGALIGKHRIQISIDEANPTRCVKSKTIEVEVKPGQNNFPIELND